MDQNLAVILIGPMGSGKSAIGQRLAVALKRQFIDTDTEIENRCGVDISYIFEKEGEQGFRRRETAELSRAVAKSGCVIATGGGIVTQACNREILSGDCFVIYLETSPEQQHQRTRHANTRPLLDTEDPAKKLRELTALRAPIYQSLADLTINTDGQRVAQIAKNIAQQIESHKPKTKQLMKTLTVDLAQRSYQITIRQNSLNNVEIWQQIATQCSMPQTVLVVSDDNVGPLYLDQLKAGLAPREVSSYILPAGEANKNLRSIEKILDHMISNKMQRDGVLIALGGGVVGDMAGFAASCFMRGIQFVQVPTTLLAQVDSSVGGKTGVNHELGKNLIGAFHQPAAVLIDPNTLSTLDPREIRAGIAEIIKYGCIFDADFFAWLESNITRLVELDPQTVAIAIERSCQSKAAIVAKDELEKGERALLNFGHSFGHAIEQVSQYKRWLHGEAVAIGMLMAGRLSVKMGLLSEADEKRITNLLEAAQLPYRAGNYELNQMSTAMLKDKKNTSTQQRLIVLEGIGSASVKSNCPNQLVRQSIQDFLGEE